MHEHERKRIALLTSQFHAAHEAYLKGAISDVAVREAFANYIAAVEQPRRREAEAKAGGALLDLILRRKQ
jgi:hypothetical protein